VNKCVAVCTKPTWCS